MFYKALLYVVPISVMMIVVITAFISFRFSVKGLWKK